MCECVCVRTCVVTILPRLACNQVFVCMWTDNKSTGTDITDLLTDAEKAAVASVGRWFLLLTECFSLRVCS